MLYFSDLNLFVSDKFLKFTGKIKTYQKIYLVHFILLVHSGTLHLHNRIFLQEVYRMLRNVFIIPDPFICLAVLGVLCRQDRL